MKGEITLQPEQVEQIAAALQLGKKEYQHWMPEAPKHICGPEAGCDAACAEYSYAVKGLRVLDEALAILVKAKPKEEELKRCPLCGGKAYHNWGGMASYSAKRKGLPLSYETAGCSEVVCGDCKLSTGWVKDPVSQWNRRVR